MADHPVFRFPMVDDETGAEKGSFLLQVIPTQGSKNPLDLRLIGTESESAYEVKLRHRRIHEWKDSQAKDKSVQCTNEEWEQILIATLIEPTSPHRKDIEVTVEINEVKDEDKGIATLVIRRNTLGVKHTLGNINLVEFEIEYYKDGTDNGPQLFDWCVAAIGDRAKVVDDLAAARAKADELERSAKELKSQLEDLLRAKEDDERHLLEKFRDLLNEKKLKIRQQQRLLASAEVDPEKLENVGASQKTVSKAKASRGGKRKAVQQVAGEESDDGFEKMDVDQSTGFKEELEDDPEIDQRQTTDEELEDATASEAEDTDEEPQAAINAKDKVKAKATDKAKPKDKAPVASRKTRGSKRKTTTQPIEEKNESDEVDDEEPPPRRTLPFQSKNKPTKTSPEPAKATNGDETETDDDEL